MDLANLQAFIAVAEHASFSLAAEQLFVTQPAVSKRISSLESELDQRLFDRIGRKITLTEAGQALLPRARRIITEIEDSRRELANLSGMVEGKLKIGTSHHIGLHRLPPLLRQFKMNYPDVALDIHFLGSEDACHAVENGELELAIITLPSDTPERLEAESIWRDPLSVVCGREHPLLSSKLSLEKLMDYPAILPGPETFTREIIERALKPGAPGPQVDLSTNYLETIKMLVSVGLGWSLLPETMLDEELAVLDIKELRISRSLGIVRHRERTLSNAAVELTRLLQRQKIGSGIEIN